MTAERRMFVSAVVLTAVIATLVGQRDAPLLGPDEMREAGISLAMARTGDLVTPRLNGAPFLQKPPLFHALAAGCFAASGATSRFVARLPAVLCGLATLAATFALARRLGGARLGGLAVMTLATMAGFVSATHRAVTDNAIPPFVVLAFLAFERARAPAERSRWAGRAAHAALGAALGLAFLAKGLVGPAVFVVGALGALAWERDLRAALRPSVGLALVVFCALAGGWLALLGAREGAAAVRTLLIENNVDRALGSPPHANPWWYYAGRLPQATLPWTPLALAGAAAVLADARSLVPRASALRLPTAWLVGGLLLLSTASAKRNIYLLPILPAAAILAARVAEVAFFEAARAPLHRRVAAALVAAACLGLGASGIAMAVARPQDLALAGAAVAAAIAGGIWLARKRFDPAGEVGASLSFLLASLAFACGLRALVDSESQRRGYEEIAAAVRSAPPEREVVLLSAGESLRGALSFYEERTVAEARDGPGVDALRRRTPERPLVVVAEGAFDELERALGSGRVLERRRILRNDVAVVLYAATSPRPLGQTGIR